jgi:hypothetical protein
MARLPSGRTGKVNIGFGPHGTWGMTNPTAEAAPSPLVVVS